MAGGANLHVLVRFYRSSDDPASSPLQFEAIPHPSASRLPHPHPTQVLTFGEHLHLHHLRAAAAPVELVIPISAGVPTLPALAAPPFTPISSGLNTIDSWLAALPERLAEGGADEVRCPVYGAWRTE